MSGVPGAAGHGMIIPSGGHRGSGLALGDFNDELVTRSPAGLSPVFRHLVLAGR